MAASQSTCLELDEVAFILGESSTRPESLSFKAKAHILRKLVKLVVSRKDPKFTTLNKWAALTYGDESEMGRRYCSLPFTEKGKYLPLVTLEPLPEPLNFTRAKCADANLPPDVVSEHLVLSQGVGHIAPDANPVFNIWKPRWTAFRRDEDASDDLNAPIHFKAVGAVMEPASTDEALGRVFSRSLSSVYWKDPFTSILILLGEIETARMQRRQMVYDEACERGRDFWNALKRMGLN